MSICEKCGREATEEFVSPDGNDVQLCERHYHKIILEREEDRESEFGNNYSDLARLMREVQ